MQSRRGTAENLARQRILELQLKLLKALSVCCVRCGVWVCAGVACQTVSWSVFLIVCINLLKAENAMIKEGLDAAVGRVLAQYGSTGAH